MTTSPHNMPTEEQINAYVDDQLSVDERRLVEDAAFADEQLAERLRLDAAINQGLQQLFAAEIDAPVPARLINSIGPRPLPWWQRIAAAIALVSIGVAIGANLPLPEQAQQLAETRPVSLEAAAAHAVYTRERRHTVEVRSDERDHLDRWLSKRLTHKFLAPDLRHHGLKLIGGRLVADTGSPAALYMYESDDGERVTIYVRAQAKNTQPETLSFATDRGFEVAHWADGKLVYAVTGKLERERLQQVTRSVQQ